MPAGFNKGQIEYIKTIANVNGHKTYKSTKNGVSNSLAPATGFATHDTFGKYKLYCLGQTPTIWNSGSTNTKQQMPTLIESIPVYDVPINTNQANAGPGERVTPECFLESVHMRMRLIQQLDVTDAVDSHQEYRMVVFRHKEKQHADEHLAENYANPLYDMFHASDGYKYGPKGHRNLMDVGGDNDYSDAANDNNDIQSLLSLMLNKEDYVIMKDCRFYLGKEYGGKHIFETAFHWDHKDPIVTNRVELSTTESNKNYCWYIAIFCTTNQPEAAASFPYIRFDATTHVTSG